jgi:hypothetical protein
MNIYLWSQVESQVAVTRQIVLNEKRNLVGQAELDGGRETRSFAEVDKVFEGEGECNRLREFNVDVQIWLLHIGMASQGNSSISDIAVAGELHTVL